jgi:hypothetical protein
MKLKSKSNLAYRYGLTGLLPSIGFDPVLSILSIASFGALAQALQSVVSLEQGLKRSS